MSNVLVAAWLRESGFIATDIAPGVWRVPMQHSYASYGVTIFAGQWVRFEAELLPAVVANT